ncbi:MAG: glycosyltransferase family 39 protein [Thermoleophilia bacterium]|nr:glycosyltransferase family 39 protein [Thermoleophilia bacterium]
MSRRRAYAAVAAACVVPRLAVLLHERGTITAAFTEKSDVFARTFVHTGTYGFLPGEPSAYTQPLYGFVLIPVYWLAGSGWLAIGLAQIALALVTAWLVYEIGRRVVGARAGAVAAAIATLNPYLVWHDVHVNREIVDQVCAAALVLLALLVAERPSRRLAALLGVVTGLAILGNTRLVGIPVLCAAYLLWRLPRTRAAAVAGALVLGGAAVAVAPWLLRNKVELGCWAITTDGRALWKANNPQTYPLLSSGQWIDNVSPTSIRPPAPNRITPEEAWGYLEKGRPDYAYRLYPNECAQMRFYEHQAFRWVRDHPGAKAKLGLLSLRLLWQPSVTETSGRPGAGTQLDVGRRIVEPVYMWVLYALAAAGLLLVPRPFAALVLALLAYDSAAAFAFVGATRYRVAWDFLVALLAAAALARAAEWARERRGQREAVGV